MLLTKHTLKCKNLFESVVKQKSNILPSRNQTLFFILLHPWPSQLHLQWRCWWLLCCRLNKMCKKFCLLQEEFKSFSSVCFLVYKMERELKKGKSVTFLQKNKPKTNTKYFKEFRLLQVQLTWRKDWQTICPILLKSTSWNSSWVAAANR